MANYKHSRELLDQALDNSLQSFAEWCAINWKLEPVGAYSDPEHTPEFRKGWDAAITELGGALDCFKEEYGY